MASVIRDMERFAKDRGWWVEKVHNGLRFHHDQCPRFVTVSAAWNDPRALRNFKTEIRRVERAAGVNAHLESPFGVLAPLKAALDVSGNTDTAGQQAQSKPDEWCDPGDAARCGQARDEQREREQTSMSEPDANRDVTSERVRHPRTLGTEDFLATVGKNRAGESRLFYHIECCFCPQTDVIQGRKAPEAGPSPSTQISMRFRQRGWETGKHRNSDVCPTCAGIMAGRLPESARRQPEPKAPDLVALHSQNGTAAAKPLHDVNHIADKSGVGADMKPLQPTAIGAEAIPAGRLSLAEKVAQVNFQALGERQRIIDAENDKARRHAELWRKIHRAIDRAYIDRDTGYAAGESDEKIAARYGVTVAEIAQRREQHFGPLVADSDYRDIVREMHALKKDLTYFQKNVMDAAASLENRITSVLAKFRGAPHVAQALSGYVEPADRQQGTDKSTMN